MNSDDEFKRVLKDFINIKLYDLFRASDTTRSATIYDKLKGMRIAINILQNHFVRKDIDNAIKVSWMSYCENMHKVKKSKQPNKEHTRKFVCEFYKFIITNVDVPTDEIKELEKYRGLLDIKERMKPHRNKLEWSSFVNNQLATNFPLKSRIEELYLYSYLPINPERNDYIETVVYLKNTNLFLKSLLIEFIESFPKDRGGTTKPSCIHYRQFFYYFSNSLSTAMDSKQLLPENITEFNFVTFKKQYRFYKMLDNEFCLLSNRIGKDEGEKSCSILDVLKEFYLFLIHKIKDEDIEYNPFLGTAINEEILSLANFRDFFEKGYCFIKRTGLEDIPIRNRWALVVDDNKANSSRNRIRGLDFTEITNKEFREDLKKFIWNEFGISSQHLVQEYRYIRSFFILKSKYDLDNKKVINLEKTRGFTEEFMLYFRAYMISKYNDSGTIIGAAFSSVRKFLKYNYNKYALPDGLFTYLELKSRGKRVYGGHPIPKGDYELIKEGIGELRNNSIEGKLYFIIFVLNVTTKLRIGEILNLERNCIISVDYNEGTGEIEYYSKLSNKKLIKTKLSLDKINLIKKADEITSELYYNSISEDKKYIFIKKLEKFENRNSDKVMVIQIKDSKINDVLKEILKKKSIEDRKYKVNQLRHTFKDTIWREGIKDGINPMRLEYMTGTTFGTDVKNYRTMSNARTFAEFFSGVTISDVSINGDIVINEDELERLNSVENGRGVCKHTECKKKSNNDEMFKCLTCDSFVTCVSRQDTFKRRINELKEVLTGTISIQEKIYYDAELKLNAAFYSKIIEIKEMGD